VASEVTLRVKAGVVIRCRPCGLSNGESVLLHGRLLDPSLPPEGKLVTLQARTSRGWRTFATARARGRDAVWSYRYRFTDTTTTATYAFRIVVPADSGYAYTQGNSRVVRVRVRGEG
jgi:hypothetical protein